jgi:hypothetical protein
VITTLALAVAAVVATAAAPPDDRREVRLQAAPAGEVTVDAPVIDRLDDGELLVVRVTDGVDGASGQVRQCRLTVHGFAACANVFPVQFDDEGAATFQYQVFDREGCDGSGAACVVVVADGDNTRLAHAVTIFGASAPPAPEVTLTPPGPYSPGARVRVEVSSLPPGAVTRVALCAEDCRGETSVVAGDDGTATATIGVGERCGDCGVVVVSGATSQRVDVQFTALPSPGYDAARVVVGLALAALFLVVAWRIVRGVDWRPPSEADAPELDDEAA